MSDGITVRRLPIARKGEGKGGGGGTQAAVTTPYTPVTMPNTLRSLSSARILEVISEGPIAGLYFNTWNSLRLDGTPLMDTAGNFNFSVLQLAWRYGFPSQDPIPGFAIAEAEFSVGVTMEYFAPVTRRLSDPGISAVRYKVQVPALYTQTAQGDVVNTQVGYLFQVSVDGAIPPTTYVAEEIVGKTMSPYERAVRVQLPPATTSIDITLMRVEPPPPPGQNNTIIFAGYTEIQDGQLAYDDTACAAVVIDAADFPTIPQRAYLIDGLIVDVPSNYDGRSHHSVGDWDGTFRQDWTNNPAWVLYALLVNERWGIGKDINAGAVDKWSFQTAAQQCDRVVTGADGVGELLFTCNCVINTRQDAWQVLTAVASNMLATLYFAAGTVFLVQDRREYSPTRLFGPADVESGLFDYTGTDYRSQFTAAAITWNDPSDSYNPSVEMVVDQVLMATQGYKETQQTAFGCTSRGQAIRLGRWLIYTSQYETEAVTFVVGLENCDVRPGDIIAINDPSRAGARLAGRLLDDDGLDTLTLDAMPDMFGDGAYWTIYVTVGSRAENETPTIVACPVAALPIGNQIRVLGKTPGMAAGCMWLASSSAVEPTSWRVASIADQGAGKFQILATEYHIEKFDYVENGWRIPPPSFSLIPSGPLPAPTNVSDTEYIYLDASGVPQFGVILSWTASADPRVSYYQIEMSGPGGEYRFYNLVSGITQDVPLMSQGQWAMTIRAFDNIGRRSAIVNYSFIPIGLSAVPLEPSALYITPQGGNLSTLIWIPTGEIDVVLYWVKWTSNTTSATWERATTSIAQVDRNTTQINTPTRAGTFMVKSVDKLGQESVGWAEAILIPQQTERSIFFDEHQEPTWGGTLGPVWHHNLGELWMPPPDAPEPVPPGVFPGDRATILNQTATRVGIYDFDHGFDLGASTLVTMTGYVEGYGTRLGLTMSKWTPLSIAVPIGSGTRDAMSNWVPLAIALPLAMGSSAEWDAHIEARVSQDGVTYADWFPLKSTVITGQSFEWRMVGTLYDLLTTLRAVHAGVIVEVPLRNVQGSAVALDGTGHLSVVYAAPFLVPPTVQITVRDSVVPGGDILLSAASDRDHFEVQQVDAAGNPSTHAGAAIDYFVQGYGGHA